MEQIYLVQNINDADPQKLFSGFYLGLIKLNQTPPHLVLINDGKVFSLSVKGVEIGGSLPNLLKLIQVKQMPCLFFEVRKPDNVTDFNSSLNLSFLRFNSLGLNGVTCLSPIKNFFSQAYHIHTGSVNLIFDLLPLLFTSKQIAGVTQLNLSHNIYDSTFKLEKYDMSKVVNAIEKVQKISV